MELFGAKRNFKELKIKKHKEEHVLNYITQFNNTKNDGYLKLDSRNFMMKKIFLSNAAEKDDDFIIDDLISERWETNIIQSKVDGELISFGEKFESCYFDDCLFINNFKNVYRIKDIVHISIVNKDFKLSSYYKDTKNHLNSDYIYSTKDLFGIKYILNVDSESATIGSQFMSSYLIPSIRETTIGTFIEEHPTIITVSLNYTNLLYEPTFEWIEGNSDSSEKEINPDLMLRRPDGFYDICDLKKPLLEKTTLTKGDHKRRRFTDYISEGIAQLSNYEDVCV